MSLHKNRIFLLLLFFAIVSTVLIIKSVQIWQRSHFDCTGDLSVEYPSLSGNISVRYIFNGDKGVAILRGEITPVQGRAIAVNHNVWFSFTRNAQDYFLQSERISVSTGDTTIYPELIQTLPDFYLHTGVPFYLNIIRTDGNHWLFFTSRSPSIYCKA
ncbi:hypothetical protein [Phytobacter sp. RSE-02]|uniref:hypothetical protein n=1 Tax=Phytobacter sp. RSE-02 TaxID=3229229 RepID=UPI00339D5F07